MSKNLTNQSKDNQSRDNQSRDNQSIDNQSIDKPSPENLMRFVSNMRRMRRMRRRNVMTPNRMTKLFILRTNFINQMTDNQPLTMSRLYYYLHCFLAVFAIFLSFKCPNGFDLANFLSALIAPHIYLIFIIATRGLNFCFN
jgi:hypothetical protein